MKRPGFRRLLLIVLVLYAAFWLYKVTTHEPPAGPEIVQFVPYNYTKSDKKYPLIVFSHGFMGCPKQSIFLIQALTKQGYVVLAPRHKDATCGNDDNNKFLYSFVNLPISQKTEISFMKPEAWTEETEKDRLQDIRAALDMALNDKEIAPYIDQNNIGLMGHSLGGYTVLGMAGAWKSWMDNRVKAVIALTPYVPPYLTQGNLKQIKIPIMYQIGTKDWLTPSWMVKSAYQATGGTKYAVEFKDDGHISWMDLGKKDSRPQIIAYTTAFFDQYLKGKNSALLSTEKPPEGITLLSEKQ